MPYAEEIVNKLERQFDNLCKKPGTIRVNFHKETQEISIQLHYKAEYRKSLIDFTRLEKTYQFQQIVRHCLTALFQQMYNDTLEFLPSKISITKVKDAIKLIKNLEYDDLENAIKLSRFPKRPSDRNVAKARHGREVLNDLKNKLGNKLGKFFPKETNL